MTDQSTDASIQAVLVVASDHRLSRSVEQLLDRRTHKVIAAASVESALEILASQPVAIILCGEQAPGVCSDELLRVVMLRWPDTLRVMATRDLTACYASEVGDDGVAHLALPMPWSRAELFLTVRHALEMRALLDEKRELVDLIHTCARVMSTFSRQSDSGCPQGAMCSGVLERV
ncbi:MAG TPA: hypothetical protein VGL38_15675 [bacterium]